MNLGFASSLEARDLPGIRPAFLWTSNYTTEAVVAVDVPDEILGQLSRNPVTGALATADPDVRHMPRESVLKERSQVWDSTPTSVGFAISMVMAGVAFALAFIFSHLFWMALGGGLLVGFGVYALMFRRVRKVEEAQDDRQADHGELLASVASQLLPQRDWNWVEALLRRIYVSDGQLGDRNEVARQEPGSAEAGEVLRLKAEARKVQTQIDMAREVLCVSGSDARRNLEVSVADPNVEEVRRRLGEARTKKQALAQRELDALNALILVDEDLRQRAEAPTVRRRAAEYLRREGRS